MTGRATFGDFARTARRHLDLHDAGPDVTSGAVGGAARSLLRLTMVMDRYLSGIGAVLGPAPGPQRREPDAWARAYFEACGALRNAAAFLRLALADADFSGGMASQNRHAASLDAASALLTAGHDLLQTHFHADPGGASTESSEWAPVITSAPLARSLLREMALTARRAAAHGAPAFARRKGKILN